MAGRATFVLAMAVAAATAGCGTLDNIKRPVLPPPGNPDAPVCRVYGGVTGEWAVMSSFPKESISSPLDYVLIPVLGAIDLVLTIAGDTVTLPYSLYAEVRRRAGPPNSSQPPPGVTNIPAPPPPAAAQVSSPAK